MESFYGGRQGASFVIVKQFDSIESMVQCFEQGAVTTNEVNYGEYVIIDTINKNNPDNGKVYRRGLNYQYSENNSLAGAEYIGQIVGPQGDSPEVSVDDFDTIINEPYNGPEKEYNMINGGIVKGAEIIYDDEGKIDENQSVFNDSIKYTWVTIRDEYGTVKGCKIGFVFPCITLDFIGTPISAYEKNNLVERMDNGNHPFFAQWNIKIPKGIKGNTLNNLEIEGSLAFKGTAYYGDKECTNKLGILDEDTFIDFNSNCFSTCYLIIINNFIKSGWVYLHFQFVYTYEYCINKYFTSNVIKIYFLLFNFHFQIINTQLRKSYKWHVIIFLKQRHTKSGHVQGGSYIMHIITIFYKTIFI